MKLRLLALATLLLVIGCSSTKERREMFPAFYRGWEPTPTELTDRLETKRETVIQEPKEINALLEYARATSELTRIQSDLWLELRSREGRLSDAQKEQIAAVRNRVVNASSNSLSLFRQYELTGGALDWRSNVEMAWLLLLVGSDQEAEQRIAYVLTNPEIPAAARQRLEQSLERFAALPEENATSE